MTILYEDDRLPGGKYRGQTVADVAREHPGYIKKFNDSWSTSSLYRKFCISDEVMNNMWKYVLGLV